MPQDEQYVLGFEAGQVLVKIHTIRASGTVKKWPEKFLQILEQIRTPPPIPNANLLLNYIENNAHLLCDIQQTFLHGDYDVQNMLYDTSKRKLTIVDFDSYGFGDPWMDLYRTMYRNKKTDCAFFYIGLYNGYFNGEPPQEFWPLQLLYMSVDAMKLAVNRYSSRPHRFPKSLTHIENLLYWYDEMNNPIPKWYKIKNQETG